MKISELNDDQRGHLAYLLERNTYCGYGTSCRIAKGEFGDMSLEDAFQKADKSPRWAKYYAKKVMEFKIDADLKAATTTALSLLQPVMQLINNNTINNRQQIIVTESLIKGLQGLA